MSLLSNIDPDSAPARYNLAVLPSVQGRFDEAIKQQEAIEHLRIAAQLDPRYAAILNGPPTEKTAPHESE